MIIPFKHSWTGSKYSFSRLFGLFLAQRLGLKQSFIVSVSHKHLPGCPAFSWVTRTLALPASTCAESPCWPRLLPPPASLICTSPDPRRSGSPLLQRTRTHSPTEKCADIYRSLLVFIEIDCRIRLQTHQDSTFSKQYKLIKNTNIIKFNLEQMTVEYADTVGRMSWCNTTTTNY